MSQYVIDRCKASLFAGAIGDGLGAPVEIKKLHEIIEMVGPAGVTHFLVYDPKDYLKWAPCEQTGKGVITDDTCMTAATVAGFFAAWNAEASKPEDQIGFVHQAYLRWGAKQAWAQKTDYTAPGMIDPSLHFAPWLDEFCFSSGAGKGTIYALNSGRIGTLDAPMMISDSKGGQPFASVGCGGMMRVAPVGWLAALGRIDNAFDMGCRVAAITHGSEIAQDTSGAVAVLIERLCLGHTWESATDAMHAGVCDETRRGNDNPLSGFYHDIVLSAYEDVFRYLDPSQCEAYNLLNIGNGLLRPVAHFDAFDHLIEDTLRILGRQEKPRLFDAEVVFIQSLLICHAAQRWFGNPSERLRWALTLAATQDGDSDSVASIVGQILGAQLGLEAVETLFYGDLSPQSFVSIVDCGRSLQQMML